MNRESKRVRIQKNVVGYILSFLLFLLLLASFLCIFARTTFMNSHYIGNVISNSQYSRQMASELQQQMIDWGSVSGVTDTTIFTDIVTEERIFADTQTFFQGAMQGDGRVDTTALRRELYDAVYAYAQKGDVSQVSEEELRTNIEHLVDLCASGYEQSLGLILVPQAGGVLHKISKFVDFVWVGCLILSALIIVMLYRIHPFFKRTLRFTIYAATSLVVLWWAAVLWVKTTGIISRIAITSQPLYTLATDFMNAMWNTSLGFAVVSTVIVIALFLCYYTLAEVLLKRKLSKTANSGSFSHQAQ